VSEAFAPGLTLRPALERTAATGFAHLDRALDERFRRALLREIERGPMRRMAGEFGAARVRMQIEGYDVDAPFEGFPLLAELAAALRALVVRERAAVRGLATWRVTEAGVGRYRPGPVGITAHRDGRWYRRLVAVLTLVGSARFEVLASREGELVEAWDARSGGLTLMRGPGLAGLRDGRPFHLVHAPRRGVRCSLALRMRDDRSSRI
jgi:hypothetical protein